MSVKLSKFNIASLVLEGIGLTVMTIGGYLEYLYKADVYMFGITGGAIIFSVGSALVKKFPWAKISRKG